MKTIHYIILFIVLLAVSLNVTTRAINRTNCRNYSLDLQKQGYSKSWANHKANVEYGYVKADKLYESIEED